MSYCRWSKGISDVYVFETRNHVLGPVLWECCGCCIARTSLQFKTKQEMILHLEEHRHLGHLVPQYAIDQLRKEIVEENKRVRN